jgi:methionyl aminopeptidase
MAASFARKIFDTFFDWKARSAADMSNIKTPAEQELMRAAGKAAARTLRDMANEIAPGVKTRDLDEFAAERMRALGGRSAFLGYRNFPRHTCISINDEVVHGLAGEREIKSGDLISIDVGVTVEGYIGDNATTVPVGDCDKNTQKLVEVTERSLYAAISCAVAGNRVRDISQAVQDLVEGNGFSVVREFVGHGVGRTVHEEPQVPNHVDPRRKTPELVPGMTLAIEPMVNAGAPAVKTLRDGWTVVTRDGRPSAHFEHTVLIRDGEPEILTWLDGKK